MNIPIQFPDVSGIEVVGIVLAALVVGCCILFFLGNPTEKSDEKG